MRHAPASILVALQPPELVIGLEGIAAGLDEAENVRQGLLVNGGIRGRATYLGQHLVLVERRRAGRGHDVLGQHVERAGTEDILVELAFVDRVQRRPSLQKLESIARDEQSLARLVEPVIGAADPLQQSRRTLGRAHLDDEVDVAPVDAKVEAGRAHQSAQAAGGDRCLDLAACLDREAAMVDSDRQGLLVHLPEILEDQLGEAAGVAEDQGGRVALDFAHHILRGPAPAMARPGYLLVFGQHDRDLGLGAGVADYDIDQFGISMGGEPALIGFGIGDGRRQADRRGVRRDALEPRQAER